MEQDWKEICSAIKGIKIKAQELKAMAEGVPALDRNLRRVLASIRMLELNFSDVFEMTQRGKSS